ncbi:MAG TPA: glycosyltransferase family 2 protein [Polymorphobacter sp.]|nr:glycosyltransferase family 2 protein [Polymorphobacter sp.]
MSVIATTPKVSAVLIFLNGEDFIAEAIESVRTQTFTDWELILVDDGTTDGARAIAHGYAEREPQRIRLIEHPGHANRGMSASRNAGIAAARGNIITFIDADDIWLPRRLAAHVAILDQHPEIGVVLGATMWWRSWMTDGRSWLKPWLYTDTVHQSGLPLDRVIAPPEVAINYLESRGGSMPGICSVTVRRDVVRAVGGFNDDFRTLFEDQVFHFRTALRVPIWASDEVVACYRQHDESACNKEGRMASDLRMRPLFLAWLQDHLVDSGCKDARLWKAFRAEMMRFDQPTLWWWTRLPVRARDWWNVHRQRLWIMLLTPAGYNRLRRWLGMSHADQVPALHEPVTPEMLS